MVMKEVFQDEVVRATDLNRSSGEVLNKASKRPVTIVRNDEAFALMRRELAASWRQEANYAFYLAEVMWSALNRSIKLGPEFQWISAFDDEDRQVMATELMEAYRKATRDGSWGDLEATIHEWSESGWAALNPEIREAFDCSSEAVPLPSKSPVTA